jgi:hypothetical protein
MEVQAEESGSRAEIRSSCEPPRSSYLKSMVRTSFAWPKKAITSASRSLDTVK